MTVVAVLAVAVLVGALVVILTGDDDADEATSTSTSPSATAPPCVAPTGEPPAGAPAVPVEEGPAPTELVIEDLRPGDGDEVVEGATVTVNYIGVACSTGTVFDESYSREPATFSLEQVVPGWQQGIPGMKVGGQRLLAIPPDLAYGAQGSPPAVGPNETLWFVVEVLETQPPGS